MTGTRVVAVDVQEVVRFWVYLNAKLISFGCKGN